MLSVWITCLGCSDDGFAVSVSLVTEGSEAKIKTVDG